MTFVLNCTKLLIVRNCQWYETVIHTARQRKPTQRPTKMGCVELIIMCVCVGLCVGVGVGLCVGVGVGVGQCEHTIRIKLGFIRAKATSYEENPMNVHIKQRQLSEKTNRFCFHSV